MMRIGVIGSLASFDSIMLNRMKQMVKAPKENIVSWSAQEILPPLSSPNNNIKTVRTRVTAPPKSTRLSLAKKSEYSALGR